MNSTAPALKRFGRYIVAYIIAGGIEFIAEIIPGVEFAPLVQPILTAVIAATGKYIREKWKIRVPF